MPLASAQENPLWLNALLFLIAAALVWGAGTRLTRYLDGISQHTGLGQAFVGMLLLGGITSLPEVANTVTSALTENPRLGINNLLGSAAINVFLIAVADACIGRDAVTSVVASPSTLMLGTLCMLLLISVAAAVVTGDVLVLGVGVGALVIFAMSIGFFGMAAGYEKRAPWKIQGELERARQEDDDAPQMTLRSLTVRSVIAATAIFGAGYVLSQTGDALAVQTGLGSGWVGFALIGVATSLPELSTIVTALRIRRYEMAFGQVFGTNFVNISLILAADLAFPGGPVLNELGRFEVVSALLGAMLAGVFLVGLLERRDARVLRAGYDSVVVIVLFACGLGILAVID